MATPSSLCSAQRAVAFAGSNDILSKKVGVLLYRKRSLFSGEISESYPIAESYRYPVNCSVLVREYCRVHDIIHNIYTRVRHCIVDNPPLGKILYQANISSVEHSRRSSASTWFFLSLVSPAAVVPSSDPLSPSSCSGCTVTLIIEEL